MSESLNFPKGFLWGAATSSHQVEGNNFRNDWWEWEQAGRLKEKSELACNHLELYEKDFDIAKSLYHNAHRLSIEWSRVEPEPGKFDDAAIEHYRKVLEALRARDIEPVVTLHHFTNPVWFSRLGGWRSDQCSYHFERYANKIAQKLGKLIRYWITINEPNVYIYLGHIIGEWPPGEKMPKEAMSVFRNFLLAHQHAYRVIHGVCDPMGTKPMVSFAQNVAYHTPCSPWSLRDWFASYLRHVFFSRLQVEALVKGYLFFPGIFKEKLLFKNSLDYIGLNYYTREFVHFANLKFPDIFGDDCSTKHHKDIAKRNPMGWESYPEGLYQILLEMKRFNLPIMITENGTCTTEDSERREFIQRHVLMVKRAIEKGVNVLGYLYWSLLDNYEWARGYEPRFGLVEVDYKTQQRKVRQSALTYSEICRTNAINL